METTRAMETARSAIHSSVYTRDAYLRAAERVRRLNPCEHHSQLDPARLADALRRAAARPAEPVNIELLDSLPLVVYVPVA